MAAEAVVPIFDGSGNIIGYSTEVLAHNQQVASNLPHSCPTFHGEFLSYKCTERGGNRVRVGESVVCSRDLEYSNPNIEGRSILHPAFCPLAGWAFILAGPKRNRPFLDIFRIHDEAYVQYSRGPRLSSRVQDTRIRTHAELYSYITLFLMGLVCYIPGVRAPWTVSNRRPKKRSRISKLAKLHSLHLVTIAHLTTATYTYTCRCALFGGTVPM